MLCNPSTPFDEDGWANMINDMRRAYLLIAGGSNDLNAGSTSMSQDTVEDEGTGSSAEVATSAALDEVSDALTEHIEDTGTAVHGLGTMSTQNASSVNITGGTLAGISSLANDSGTLAVTASVMSGVTSGAMELVANSGMTLSTAESMTIEAHSGVVFIGSGPSDVITVSGAVTISGQLQASFADIAGSVTATILSASASPIALSVPSTTGVSFGSGANSATSNTVTHKAAVIINGVVYYILLSTSST